MNGGQVVKDDAGQAQQDESCYEEADKALRHAGDYTPATPWGLVKG